MAVCKLLFSSLNFALQTKLLLNQLPLTPKVGPWDGCLRQAKELTLRWAVNACTSPMVTVLFPSPRGVGVILIWEGKKVSLIVFPRQPMQNQSLVQEPNWKRLVETRPLQNALSHSIFLGLHRLLTSRRLCLRYSKPPLLPRDPGKQSEASRSANHIINFHKEHRLIRQNDLNNSADVIFCWWIIWHLLFWGGLLGALCGHQA